MKYTIEASDVHWEDMPNLDADCFTSDFTIDWIFSFHISQHGFIKDINASIKRVRGSLIIEHDIVIEGRNDFNYQIDTNDERWNLEGELDDICDNVCPSEMTINLKTKTIQIQFTS